MDTSQIKTAKYYKDSDNKNTAVDVTFLNDDHTRMSIPLSEGNTDYREILAWVAEGNTIEPADE